MGSAEKNLVIVKAVLAERSLADVARQYDVSKAWVHKLLHRYREHGWPGLQPRSRRPHKPANQTPAAVVARVLQLRNSPTSQGLDAGTFTIGSHLLREQPTGAKPGRKKHPKTLTITRDIR